MTYLDIDLKCEGQVATIKIHRPSKLNALRAITITELEDAVGAAASNSAIGVIVLTGEGDRLLFRRRR